MSVRVINGDCRAVLPTLDADSFDCIVTSPPYFGLRDYGCDGQIGLEPTLEVYVETMVGVFDELRRVLKPSGTAWLNIGDSYNNRTKVRTTSHQPALNGFVDDNWAERAARGGVRMSNAGFGLKEKDLCGVPWRVAFALQADGWWLRSAIVWAKPNPMPESVTDRPTSSYEMVFLLTKSERYFYDADAIREPMAAASISRLSQDVENQSGSLRANGGTKTNGPMKAVAKGNARTFRGGGAYTGSQSFDNSASVERTSHGNVPNEAGDRNARNVWTIATQPFKGSHFATMPPDLAERCIKAGCPRGGHVLDPFGGAGTSGLVADRLGRHATLIELNPAYRDMAANRVFDDAPLFSQAAE